jgi:trehalose 6-phosphate phosphatase
MKDILSRAGSARLREFASTGPLLVFDFDGTLSPIVPVPHNARLTVVTRRLLEQVCSKYRTAVLSGRERSDVAARLSGIRFTYIVGNHGLQWQNRPTAGQTARVKRWQKMLGTFLANGDFTERESSRVLLENKKLSLSIHSRTPAVLSRLQRYAALLPGARVVAGKNVINVLPEKSHNKGTAVLALAARERRGMIFVGDDQTDEDVFCLRPGFELLTVRVQRSNRSRAQYFLRNQRNMDLFLKILLAARS